MKSIENVVNSWSCKNSNIILLITYVRINILPVFVGISEIISQWSLIKETRQSLFFSYFQNYILSCSGKICCTTVYNKLFIGW